MSRAVLDQPPIDAGPPGGGPELEVLDPDGGVSRVELGGEHLLIGRGPESGLRLEGGTVSRQHAEIFRDPFGRWWVRDLGSRNGVKVAGERVAERVLQPGNTFQLGQYRLTFRVARPAAPAPSDTSATGVLRLDDGAADRFSTLDEGDHPRIAAGHLSALMKFGRELLDADDPAARLDLLCRLMVSPEFKGRCALVFRAARTDPGTDVAPAVLGGPVSCASAAGCGDDANPPYLSRSLVRHLRQTAQPVLASNLPGTQEAIEVSMAPDVATVSAVACPLVDASAEVRWTCCTSRSRRSTARPSGWRSRRWRPSSSAWPRTPWSPAATPSRRAAHRAGARAPGRSSCGSCSSTWPSSASTSPSATSRLLARRGRRCRATTAGCCWPSPTCAARDACRADRHLAPHDGPHGPRVDGPADILAAMRPQIGDVCEDSFVTMAAVQIDLAPAGCGA